MEIKILNNQVGLNNINSNSSKNNIDEKKPRFSSSKTIEDKVNINRDLKTNNKTSINLTFVEEPDKEVIKKAIKYNTNNLPVPLIEKIQIFFKLPSTGLIDEQFVQKVIDFQKNKNLNPDGIIGNNTLKQMISSGLNIKDLAQGEYPRYDEIFKDGLLDTTIGIGFSEDGMNTVEEKYLIEGLSKRGYREISFDEAKKIYEKAGRQLPEKNSNIQFFYKANVTTFNNKPVDSIIQVIKPGFNDNLGKELSSAFKDGLDKSDFTVYSGHGRYGTGPDFDRNFKIVLKTIDGKKLEINDYEILEKKLQQKNNNFLKSIFGDNEKLLKDLSSKSGLQILQILFKEKKIELITSNDGNIVINKKSPHHTEIGGYLMEQALKLSNSTDITDIPKENKYRIWVFNGCRTNDYLSTIRGTNSPHLNTKNLEVLVTTKTIPWVKNVDNILTYIDGLINKESIEQLKKRMHDIYNENYIKDHGFKDNPSLKIN